MAFTNLKSYSETEWNNLRKSPVGAYNTSRIDSPDPNVSVQLAGWVSDTVLAFTVTDAVDVISGLQVDALVAKTIDVNVGSVAPTSVTYYWTVDVGSDDGRLTDWSIAFATARSGTKSGSYVFAKPKDEHPDPHHA